MRSNTALQARLLAHAHRQIVAMTRAAACHRFHTTLQRLCLWLLTVSDSLCSRRPWRSRRTFWPSSWAPPARGSRSPRQCSRTAASFASGGAACRLCGARHCRRAHATVTSHLRGLPFTAAADCCPAAGRPASVTLTIV
jgi:hypothetical protein